MRKWIPLIGLFITLPALSVMADSIYKWVDADGQIHFSDVPHEGAKEVAIAPVQTFSLPPVASMASASGSDDKEADDKAAVSYTSLEITSPGVEETIWNTAGKVTVAVNLQPGLQTGHQIRLSMDGQLLANLPPRTSSVELADVYRGEHLLSAEVTDETGKVLIKAPPRKFFYQQTSVNRR